MGRRYHPPDAKNGYVTENQKHREFLKLRNAHKLQRFWVPLLRVTLMREVTTNAVAFMPYCFNTGTHSGSPT